jgi:hypothetical protein
VTARAGRVRPLVLAAFAVTGVAQAEIVDLAFDSAGRFAHRAPVAPGKFVEVCGKLARGQAVSWEFQADGPLDFNIHYHEGKKVVMPDKRERSAAEKGQLKVQLDQDYCWMWSNKTTVPVQLTLGLQR